MSAKIQKILIVVVLLIMLSFLGYKLFTQQPTSVDDTVTSTGSGVEMDGSSQDILSLVGQLEKIKIKENKDFFQEPMFMRLTDSSQTIFPEAQGRINPFALIGYDSFLSGLNLQNQQEIKRLCVVW